MDTQALEGRLLFAIPKKGRLHDKCLEILAGADIQFRRHPRMDVALVLNHPVALVFLPASDIPSFVGKGNIDLGITGQDVILEARMENHVSELLKLGFGKCSLQVQVPLSPSRVTPALSRKVSTSCLALNQTAALSTVDNPTTGESGKEERGKQKKAIMAVEELAGGRIVTSFEVLAGKYFKELDERLGLAEDKRTTIEYVGGSVEAACSLGLADGIVDLVESGDTMRAAGLHAIATLLTSEAVLIQSSTPKHPSLLPLLNMIKRRIEGVITASKYVICQYNIPRLKLSDATAITPGRRAPTISPLEDEIWVAVSSMVLKKDVAGVMDRLTDVGAEDILIFNLDNCRV